MNIRMAGLLAMVLWGVAGFVVGWLLRGLWDATEDDE